VNLGSYVNSTTLNNLTGRGILYGAYINVVDGYCGMGPGAYSATNEFSYAYSDTKFQDVMAYKWSDSYRSALNDAGVLLPATNMYAVANCRDSSAQDNAFYTKATTTSGTVVDMVCIGYSSTTPGAQYGDDATVVIHELQHANTGHSYSPTISLNQFYYDEAGAMNEGISDFAALIHTKPFLTGAFDPKFFSRWALQAFGSKSYARGAHRCPEYDATYPNCTGYAVGAAGFSSDSNRVSFSYPDGLGWSYPNNFTGSAIVKNAFDSYKSQEEIHNDGGIITGALYEIYEAFLSNNSNNHTYAQTKAFKLVSTALSTLGKPTASNLSPVTFRGFATELVSTANLSALGLSTADKNSVQTVLTDRGLYGGSTLSGTWAAVGAGYSLTPGVEFIDIVHVGAQNLKLDPGETGALFFDIQNNHALTAGGVLVDVTSPDSDIQFINTSDNPGYINAQRAQVRYGKINGTGIVSALSSSNPSYQVSTSNRYFKTNPWFDYYGNTALYITLPSTATHGKTVNLSVTVTPSNGNAQTLTFPVTIQ
jgi:hypothetical protein